MDERLQFVAGQLGGEPMADFAENLESLARPVTRFSIVIRNAALRG